MKNNSNIYDIDGNLIRKAGDNHQFTIEELQKQAKLYNDKLENLDKTDPKYTVYVNYLRNLTSQLLSLYSKNIGSQPLIEQTTDNEVKKAIEQLKKDVENDGETGENTEDAVQGSIAGDNTDIDDEKLGNDEVIGRECSDIHEERSATQSDLLVERTDVTNNMDEYVDFVEVEQ